MSAIGPDDLVQKIALDRRRSMPIGTVRRVAAICRSPLHPDVSGLLFADFPPTGPGSCRFGCFDAINFRKLNDGDDKTELIERIRKCKPIKRRVEA